MTAAVDAFWKLRIWADNHGADLLEYTLLAGFVALSAAAVIPGSGYPLDSADHNL